MIGSRDQPERSGPHTAIIDQSSLVTQLERIQHRRAMLVFLGGTNVGAMVPLNVADVVIGRDVECDVILGDDGVSRRHARILAEDSGEYAVEDLGSTNGTTVNGEQVKRQTLRDGDRISLGRTVLKFVLQADVDEDYQKRIYELSIRDALTKVYNRRYFDERLGAEVAYARRHRSLVSLIMLDIDHFKQLNDTYGHLAGDRVLAEVAGFVQGQVRSEDVLARYGGEEFAVLVRETAPPGVTTLAERIRAGVDALRVSFHAIELAVTVSVGAATVRGSPATTPEGLIGVADRLLYQAKESGRNRVFAEANVA